MKDKKLHHNLILGSTCLMNSDDYIKALQELPKPTEIASGAKVELKSIELQSK